MGADGSADADYPSQQARDAAIDSGAGWDAAADFRAEAVALPERAWRHPVRVLDHPESSSGQVRRPVEVELQHVDLGAGYRPGDWPTLFAEMDLAEPMQTQRDDRKSRSGAGPGSIRER